MKKIAGAIVLLLVAACGGAGRVHVIEAAKLPKDLYSRPTPTPPPAAFRRFDLYFVAGDRLIQTQQVALATGSGLFAAIQALLRGPTPEERTAQVTTAIPMDTQLLEATVRDGTAVINLSREFGTAAEQPIVLKRVAQVVFTATALPGVNDVRFLLDGKPVNVTDEKGQQRNSSVSRSDYSSLAPP